MSGPQGQRQIGWLGYEQRATIKTRQPGMGAALWRLDRDEPYEFRSPKLPDTFLICAHLEGSIDWDCKTPTRRYHRHGTARTFCMALPGEQADIVLRDAHSSFVHFYIPNELFQVQLSDLVPSRPISSVEILDPMNGIDAVVDGLARRAAQLMTHPSPTSRLLVESIGLQLAAHLISQHSNVTIKGLPRKPSGLAPWQLRRVCDYMEAHLAEDISLARLGEICGLSPNHLCSAFRVSMNMPPHAWLLQTRMCKAKQLLAEPRASLTDVALAIGYADQSAFGAAFRRVFGVAPGQWRRRLSR